MIIINPCVYKLVLCAGADIYNKVNSRRNYVNKHDVSKSVCPKITNGRHLAEKHYRVRRRIYDVLNTTVNLKKFGLWPVLAHSVCLWFNPQYLQTNALQSRTYPHNQPTSTRRQSDVVFGRADVNPTSIWSRFKVV